MIQHTFINLIQVRKFPDKQYQSEIPSLSYSMVNDELERLN
jgi:hypothetical protein